MAGKVMKDYEDGKAKAEKAIGKDGKLPKPKADIGTLMTAANKTITEVLKAGEAMSTKLAASQEAITKVKSAAASYATAIDGSDFDLDPKKPDDKKKITDAQKALDDPLKEIQDFADAFIKILADVDKTLASIKSKIDSV